MVRNETKMIVEHLLEAAVPRSEMAQDLLEYCRNPFLWNREDPVKCGFEAGLPIREDVGPQ
jgi:hypothetical protein